MPSPWRANLDSAFPPFVQGAPVKSVYERAGFDINRKSPTESTYAESIHSSTSRRSRKSSRGSSRHTNYPDMASPMPPLPSSLRLESAMSYNSSPSDSRATTPMGDNPPMTDAAIASSTTTEDIAEKNAQPNQAQPKESASPHADHQDKSEQQNEEQALQPVTRPNSQASSIYSPTHDPILLAKSPPISSNRTKSLLPYQKEQQELQKLQGEQHKDNEGQSLEQILNNISAQKKIPSPLNLDDISNTSTKTGTPHHPHASNPLGLSPITETESAINAVDTQVRSTNKNSFGTMSDAPGLAYSPMPSEESSSSPTTSNDDDYTRTPAQTASGKPGVAFDMSTIASRSNSVSSNATTASNNAKADDQHLSVKSKRKVKGICRECNTQIIGKSVGASDDKLSGRWHKRCFCCMNCKSFDFQRGSIPKNNDYMGMSPPQTNEFYVLRDRPLCHACYHTENMSLCKACGAGIEGGCLDDGVSRYHVGCVRCTDCDTPLDPQRGYITVVAGNFYCPKHAELEVKLRESQIRDDQGETPVVEKRRTQLLMM